jgi:hypothetical protein
MKSFKFNFEETVNKILYLVFLYLVSSVTAHILLEMTIEVLSAL